MSRARHALGPIAALWLLCQAATLTLVPALLYANPAACQCLPGADATCPMHHKTAAGSQVCAIQRATTSPAATLNALFGVVGLLPAPARAIVPAPRASLVLPERSVASRRPSPPDPPPPRV
jgi:hypothetical protein